MILRALWFFLVGWELTIIWVALAWLFNVTLILMPLGIWMLDRVPQVLTLKSTGGSYIIDKSGESHFERQEQLFLPLRLLWFLVIGWWASLLWAVVGTLFCITIIGLPIGLLMLNRLPFVTTLRR
jgi:uncharacterized membrane protein YccF (DUF307 family)